MTETVEKQEKAPTKVMGDIGAELRGRFVEYMDEMDIPMNVALERAVKLLLDGIPVKLHVAKIKVERELKRVMEGGKVKVAADNEEIPVVASPDGEPIVIRNNAERDTLHSLLFSHATKGYVFTHPITRLDYMAIMEAT